jgi:Xaa-Pro dipeptidase
MVSRRRFLQASSVAAGASLAVKSVRPLMAAGPASLPPSIAKLKSMKDLAKPVAREEFLSRQENARQHMQSSGVDSILLMEGTSLGYFTGIHWWGGERLFAMILPVKGAPFYVCPSFEEGRAREQIAATSNEPADVRTWHEDENPYELVAQGFRDRGISTGTIGMEETVRFVFVDGISKAAPQVKIASATPVTSGCRMIKGTHEIELMRLAAKVTLAAYEAAYRALHDGMTQPEFENLIESAHTQLGFSGGADVQVGEHSSFPHGSIAPQVIREGSIVLIDGGCKVEGYNSDISRTFVLGRSSDKMNKVFDIVHAAQSAALKTARPGVQCQAVDAAARKIITDAGYGPDYKFFTHRVGHGMGMDGHEWPYLVRGNSLPLAPNMTFSDEPGIYIRGEFGVRLEDDMHITEDGAELFTPQSPSLQHPFGTA